MLKIKTVTVIGANGSMGRKISGIFASYGNAKVYMVCRSQEKAVSAKKAAIKSVKSDSISDKLIPCDYMELDKCISKSDLIFDSIVEDLEVKSQLNLKISSNISNTAIYCTGTSGLSINELSKTVDVKVRDRYLGVHMFNPPYTLTLCEIIPSDETDPLITMKVKEYMQHILNRTVIEVKDRAGFLGNRIGFQLINEAMNYAVRYKDSGGIDYIDAILGGYTGRNMSPLDTADFVGLDVHKAIIDNIYKNTEDYEHESLKNPEFLELLIKNNNLGRKTGCGLYRLTELEDSKKYIEVYDISSGRYRSELEYNFSYKIKILELLKVGDYNAAMCELINNQSQEAVICLEFMLKYICYSLYITRLVGENLFAADDAMATGFNWIPPLGLIEALGGIKLVQELVLNRLGKDYWKKIGGSKFFENVPRSHYDYRKFLRAK